ncbi:hypothetical protein DL93DRAFT_2040275, partial [Clavulina sp. PMI_390]
DEDSCIICLQSITDQTVLRCAHDQFCFDCMIIWTKQSRKCPLCSQDVGAYLIHQIRAEHDFQKYYLPPLLAPLEIRPALQARVQANIRRRRPEAHWGRPQDMNTADNLERAIERRKWVYQQGFYAKHIASNTYTKFRPIPTPSQFASSEELISRATVFIRRELCVWPNLDVQFLT